MAFLFHLLDEISFSGNDVKWSEWRQDRRAHVNHVEVDVLREDEHAIHEHGQLRFNQRRERWGHILRGRKREDLVQEGLETFLEFDLKKAFGAQTRVKLEAVVQRPGQARDRL